MVYIVAVDVLDWFMSITKIHLDLECFDIWAIFYNTNNISSTYYKLLQIFPILFMGNNCFDIRVFWSIFIINNDNIIKEFSHVSEELI